ncbi:MAG TPA: nucleotidyltransferase family protein [Pyrinomonadaceae bacterium]|nr:nucleotidyltransferase family protein [Pyrinomonadaceae bacterium]
MTRGELICTILRGAWRDSPDSDLSLSVEELDEVTPLLYDSGGAALGWWRLRATQLRDSPSAELMHQAFRLQVLFAKTHETKVQKIFRLFRMAGVEPILIKGWAIGRLYPQFGLRPSGDIDLFVGRDEYAAALEVIRSEEARDCWVDLHGRIFELADRDPEGLFRRSELLPCGDQEVRVLSAEDHFALLAVHLLKHGAWRPMWLCDLGLLLESMPESFDWKLCLGGNKRYSNWILSAIGLASKLVDAQIQSEEIAALSRQIPDWLASAVLKQWEKPFREFHESLPLMAGYLRRPVDFVREIPNRWPNPIVATINVRGEFNKYPRVGYQLCEMAARTAKFFWRLPQGISTGARPLKAGQAE